MRIGLDTRSLNFTIVMSVLEISPRYLSALNIPASDLAY